MLNLWEPLDNLPSFQALRNTAASATLAAATQWLILGSINKCYKSMRRESRFTCRIQIDTTDRIHHSTPHYLKLNVEISLYPQELTDLVMLKCNKTEGRHGYKY